MSALRLDLIVRSYPKPGLDVGGKGVERWTWRMWSGSSTRGASTARPGRGDDARARGAEVGAGLHGVADSVKDPAADRFALRYRPVGHLDSVPVRILDERTR